MKEKVMKSILLCNIVAAILLVCLVAGQFIPFWGVELPDQETGEPVMTTAALLGVTGRQYVFGDLIEKLDEITAADGGFAYQQISTQVLLTICLGGFAAFLCIRNSNGWLRAVLAIVAGGASASLWLFVPAYTLGVLGHILFALSIAVLLLSIFMIYLYVQEKMSEKKEREQG